MLNFSIVKISFSKSGCGIMLIFLQIAIFLANHPEELVKLKNKLFLRKQQKELFNTKKSADELEKMIIDMVTSQ